MKITDKVFIMPKVEQKYLNRAKKTDHLARKILKKERKRSKIHKKPLKCEGFSFIIKTESSRTRCGRVNRTEKRYGESNQPNQQGGLKGGL